MARIQLLANPEIEKWWQDHEADGKRQEKLRQATEIGLSVLTGKKIAIDADRAKLYQALETLISSGLISTSGLPINQELPESVAPEVMPVKVATEDSNTEKKPDLNRLKNLRQSTLNHS
ncbi:hypothetical protein [Cohnella soli]|uniref:Uncharacterized protein n=1 Tax=Cohnella soli TaxID=425005 RepID=A0ABW0HL70_9BACL